MLLLQTEVAPPASAGAKARLPRVILVRVAMRWLRALSLSAAFASGAGLANADPPTTHEILFNRPSGFWTSNRPAEGGAYRWRLLAIGGGVAALTGGMLVVLIRRARA
jgi:hypothetical protein